MAAFQVFIEGFDPTASTSAITRSELLQMVRSAIFVDYIGGKIYSENAPDVTIYPKYAWFTWHKLVAGVPSGEEYYWSGSEWKANTIKDGSLTGNAFANNSIGIEKIKVTPGDALKVLRANAGGTGLEFVLLLDLISNSSVALAKLVNAAAAGKVIYSGVGGVWQEASFAGLFSSQLLASGIPVANINDVALSAVANDVVYFDDAGGYAKLGQVKDRIAANTLATNKLILSGFAGKLLKVNSTGTDLEVAEVSYKAATVRGTAAQGVDGPQYTGVGPHLVPLDSKNDPQNIVKNLAASVITLGVGTYELDLMVPFETSNDVPGDVGMQVQLLRFDGVAIGDWVTWWTGDNSQGTHMHYKAIVTPTEDTNYKFMIHNVASLSFYVGVAANIASRGEVYSQLVIRKI